MNPELFEKIYTPLFSSGYNQEVCKSILNTCVEYLESMTEMVYEPVITHLQKYGNLENFRYNTRPHGFGLNYDWLVIVGISERYGIPEKLSIFKDMVYKLDYRVK